MSFEFVVPRKPDAIVLHDGVNWCIDALTAAQRYAKESPDAYGYSARGVFREKSGKVHFVVWRDQRGLNVAVEPANNP